MVDTEKEPLPEVPQVQKIVSAKVLQANYRTLLAGENLVKEAENLVVTMAWRGFVLGLTNRYWQHLAQKAMFQHHLSPVDSKATRIRFSIRVPEGDPGEAVKEEIEQFFQAEGMDVDFWEYANGPYLSISWQLTD